MKTAKLTKMPYAQAHVIIEDPYNVSLISYTTEVATIKDGVLTIHGLYSMTTRRHLSAFCAEYANIHEFKTIKTLCEKGLSLDLATGEIISL